MVTNLASLAAAWLLFLPTDFVAFGKSLVSVTLLLSNVFFWRTIQYFGDTAHTAPLLHTWSLAVEEQFYLLYPLIFLGLFRLGRGSQRVLKWGIVGAGLLSFLFCLIAQKYRPDASFYLLPTRAWELLLGAGLVFGSRTSRWLTSGRLAALGLAAILYSGLAFSEEVPYPGLFTLPPTLGSAVLLASAGTWVHRLLTNRWLVWVGKLSYSFYLVHWPVFVFFRYWEMEAASLTSRWGQFALSLFLAYLSWRFVEEPFRRNRAGAQGRVWATYVAGSLAVLAAGSLIWMAHGFPSRVPESALTIAAKADDTLLIPATTLSQAQAGLLPRLGSEKGEKIEFLVWGDSHARAIAAVFDELGKETGQRGALAWHNLTPPLLGYRSLSSFSLLDDTPAYNDAIFRFIQEQHVAKVILVGRWSSYRSDQSNVKLGLERSLEQLKAAGVQVWLLEEVPSQPVYVPRALAKAYFFGQTPEPISTPLQAYREQTGTFHDYLKQFTPGKAILLDPVPYFLGEGDRLFANSGTTVYYMDSNHLSKTGARRLRLLVAPILPAASIGPTGP